jgi:hypothetical protein
MYILPPPHTTLPPAFRCRGASRGRREASPTLSKSRRARNCCCCDSRPGRFGHPTHCFVGVCKHLATLCDSVPRPAIYAGPAGLRVCDLLLCIAPDIERGVHQIVHQIPLTRQKSERAFLVCLAPVGHVLGQICAMAGHSTHSPDTPTALLAECGRLGVAVHD